MTTRTFSPDALMLKSVRANASARLLLDAGDADGACNRAYYAMFDAARAALLASNAPVRPEIAKTHNGLISAFSLHLVKNGPLPTEIGRLLKQAEDIRILADYHGDPIDLDNAREMIEKAEVFVAEIQNKVMHTQDQDEDDDFGMRP